MAKNKKFTNGDDNWKGSNAVDDVNGKGGDDTMNGRGGNDILLGGAGNDTIIGGAGDDRMLGGAGDDRINAKVGNDTVDGGTGDDRVIIAGNFADATIVMDGDYYSITIGTQTTLVKNVELFTFDDGTYDAADIDDAIDNATPKTFILTTGVDTGANFTGGAANDVFNADNTGTDVTSGADSLDGGEGTDTLNVYSDGAAFSLPGLTSIETANIYDQDDNLDVSATSWSSVTAVNLVRGDGSMQLTVGANVKNVGLADVVNNGMTIAAAAAATALTLDLNGVTGTDDIDVTGAALTSLTVNATGAATVLDDLDAAAATSVTINATAAFTADNVATTATAATLTVTGAGAVTLGTLDTGFTTVNASAHTGGLTATLSAAAAVVTLGSGADVITTGGVTLTGSVDAGTGTDTLVTNGTDFTSTTASKYTNFENLRVTAGTVDASLIAAAALELSASGGSAVLSNVSATQAADIDVLSDGTYTIGVTGASTIGQLDTVGLTVSDGLAATNSITLTSPTLTGVETLNITAVDNVVVSTLANASSLSTVTLSGAGTFNVTTGAIASANFSLNASATTGANTFDASAFATNGVSITGGAGVDTISGSAQADSLTGNAGDDVIDGAAGADTISGGAGADTITGGAGVDTLTGGDGIDTFVFATADIDTTAGAVTDTITDFGTTDLIDGVFGAGSASNYSEAAAAVADLATLLTAADTALNGTVLYYVGQVGSDSYLVTDQDGNGYTDVIKLTGVALSGIEYADLV
jgi:Ca2+-binding RTX toxin-like protein